MIRRFLKWLGIKMPTMDMDICLRCGEILDADGRCPSCGEYGGPGP